MPDRRSFGRDFSPEFRFAGRQNWAAADRHRPENLCIRVTGDQANVARAGDTLIAFNAQHR